MKGHYEIRDGKTYDIPPCKTCKYRERSTVESPCYNCIDETDLALHKPNAETEFVNYENEG